MEDVREALQALRSLNPQARSQELARHGVPQPLRARISDLLDEGRLDEAQEALDEDQIRTLQAAPIKSSSATTFELPTTPASSSGGRGADEVLDQAHLPLRAYRRQRELGRGGMGAVYEVWDQTVHRPLAMKTLLAASSDGTRSVALHSHTTARFLNEARITGQLDHPGVVPVHEIGIDAAGDIFFTMPVVTGRSLNEILHLPPPTRTAEGWTRFRLVDVLLNVCDTIAYAHSKDIIHRDLKPHNIMVGQFGETYVMDWGLAKKISPHHEEAAAQPAGSREFPQPAPTDPGRAPAPSLPDQDPGHDSAATDHDFTDLTLPGTVMGTPMFMSPQQAAGHAEELGADCDVYAVGAILYTILAGHPPYADLDLQSSREILQRVIASPPTPLDQLGRRQPAELVSICESAMARGSHHAYEGIGDMSRDLRAYLENRVVRAHRTGAMAELRKWILRNRGTAAGIALALTVAVLAIGGHFHQQRQHNATLTSTNVELAKALADEQTANRHARSLIVAGESARLTRENPTRALLLALEAHRLEDNPVVTAAILESLLACRELRLFADSAQRRDSAAFSPDGRHLAAATSAHAVYLADSVTGERLDVGPTHTEDVTHLEFSRDGTRILSASLDGSAAIWTLATNEVLPLPGHEHGVTLASFSPDGTLVATASYDTKVRLWNAHSGELICELMGHDGAILTGEFSPDGRWLLTGSRDGTALLWDVQTGARLQEFGPHQGGVSHAHFAPDGRSLLTVASTLHRSSDDGLINSSDLAVRIWDTDGNPLTTLEGHRGLIRDAAFFDDGKKVVTVSSDESARLWDARTGKPLPGLVMADVGHSLNMVDVSKERHLLAIAGPGTSATVVDAVSGALVAEIKGHDKEVLAVHFDPSGTRLLTVSADGTNRIWSLRGGLLSPVPTRAAVSMMALNPTHPLVLTGYAGRPEIDAWDLANREHRFTLTHSSSVQQVLVSKDGTLIATLDATGSAHTWEGAAGAALQSFPVGGQIDRMAFSGDGRYLVTTSLTRGIAQRCNLATGRIDATLEVGAGEYLEFSGDGLRVFARGTSGFTLRDAASGNGLAVLSEDPDTNFVLTPDGERVVTWNASGFQEELTLWDGREGRHLRSLAEHAQRVLNVNVSPDSRWIVAASSDCSAHLWNSTSGEHCATFIGHTGPIQTCWVSNNGLRVLTGCYEDDTTRLWNGRTGREINAPTRIEARVRLASFSPGGSAMATVLADDSEVTVWSAVTGNLLLRLPGYHGAVEEVVFSADEKWIVTRTIEGMVQAWPLDVAGYAASRVPRSFLPGERALYDMDGPPESATHSGSDPARDDPAARSGLTASPRGN